MKTDRELIELAANAIKLSEQLEWVENYETWREGSCDYFTGLLVGKYGQQWNPLADNGDALRLAVILQFSIYPPRDAQTPTGMHIDNSASVYSGSVYSRKGWFTVDIENGDIFAATRRAIVIAAAEIGSHQS